MAILIDEKTIAGRTNSIRTMLSVINPRIAGDRIMNQRGNSVTIFAKDSTTNNQAPSFFKTSNDQIKASYFEIWFRKEEKHWELKKLYFQILRKKDVNDYKEVLSFHVDLDVIDECYKKHPHIHIKHPELECISNAHISLNINDYKAVTSSIENLDINLKKVVTMIEKEFISKFTLK